MRFVSALVICALALVAQPSTVFGQVPQTVIDFEDQPDSFAAVPFPSVYQGVNWTGWAHYAPYTVNGYQPAGQNAVYATLDGSSFSFSPRVFVGASFSAPLVQTPGFVSQVYFELYSNGLQVHISGDLSAPGLTFLPSGYAGTVDMVRVRTVGPLMTPLGSRWVMDNVTFDGLEIASFSPMRSGPGTNVTIDGINLGGATAVAFNGVSASFTVNSATQITALVPENASTGSITVTTPGGLATSASAFTVDARISEPRRHELIDYGFEDGGSASGYVVIVDSLGGGSVVIDWAVTVTGGNQTVFPPRVYDPTNSTASLDSEPLTPSTFTIDALNESCNGVPRRMRFRPDGVESNCGTLRNRVSGTIAPVVAPIIILKVNGQHPAGRIVASSSAVTVTLEMYPGGWQSELDFYWAVRFNEQLFWVGPSGLSATPQLFARAVPVVVGTTLIAQSFLPGTVTNWFLAADGANIVGADVIVAVVVAPTSR